MRRGVPSYQRWVWALAVLLGVAVLAALGFRAVRENFADGTGTTVTYYYLPTCPWCQKFTPEWNKFKEAAKANHTQVVEVDASKDPAKAKANGVSAFPTLIITQNGQDTVYAGERSADALMKSVLDATTPSQ